MRNRSPNRWHKSPASDWSPMDLVFERANNYSRGVVSRYGYSQFPVAMVDASSSDIWPVQVVAGMLANTAHATVTLAHDSGSQVEHATELSSADAWARLIGQISATAKNGG